LFAVIIEVGLIPYPDIDMYECDCEVVMLILPTHFKVLSIEAKLLLNTGSVVVVSYVFADLGCGVIAVAYLEMMCWYRSSYNQSERIRSSLFRSILRQEIGWFDTQEIGELNTRLVEFVTILNLLQCLHV